MNKKKIMFIKDTCENLFVKIASVSMVVANRTRYEPTCHYINVLCVMKTTSDHFGWWMMLNLSRGDIYLEVALGNMTQPHHLLHQTRPTLHSKHTKAISQYWDWIISVFKKRMPLSRHNLSCRNTSFLVTSFTLFYGPKNIMLDDNAI